MTIGATPGRPRLRVAFYGRVAHHGNGTEEQLTRQYEQCRRALPAGSIAVFYEVGPRGAGHTAAFDRITTGGAAGGLDGLRAEAARPGRRFDYLTASEPFRLACDPGQAIELLRRLRSARIQPLSPLVAATGQPAGMTDLLLSAVPAGESARITDRMQAGTTTR